MNLKDFKSGIFIPHIEYRSFLPEKVNIEWEISSPTINILLEEANLGLGELNAFSDIVPDVDLFIGMHIAKEATKSSRIEGTRTNIDDAVLKESEILPEKKDDWREVQNYIKAMNEAISLLPVLPVSTRLIQTAHKILLENVRGNEKLPGEYRKSQNWIGGATIKDAVFIPPHHDYLNELMSDLENFINNKLINVPHLIKIAIAHYQFETIHPFLDGNGRVGRLMITLYLVANNILTKPTLYLSDFFDKNKQLYYDNLTLVRTNNNLEQWIKFFLTAVIETANKGKTTFREILKLREDIEEKRFTSLGRKLPLAKKLINYLYRNPVITKKYLENELEASSATIHSILKDFVRLGILKEITGQRRNRIFVFEEYLNLFR